jgi:hypothetical protein
MSGPLAGDQIASVMFELALGAEWALCGAEVELLEPDLLLKVLTGGCL